MSKILYSAELTKAAQIWAQKNGFFSALETLPQLVLEKLQNQDLLEVEIASGKTSFFSVLRKTVRIKASGDVLIVLFLDHPAR